MGRAGIVLGLEVSRLARNSADWHRLLEIWAPSDTLIQDEDGVYDPGNFKDRLLVRQKAADDAAVVYQTVPLCSVSSEPGRVHRQDDADLASADRREHAVEARTCAAAARTAQILVDHDRFRPSPGSGPLLQAILPLMASGIGENLLHGGLRT